MNYMGGQYGFPSSHATNSFALAVLLGWAWPRRWGTFIGLALLVSYSRIYLGVHYPGDILGGAALGSLVAGLLLISYRELSRLYPSLAWRPASKEKPQ
jgi:undecaprenyl-diphosphatase